MQGIFTLLEEARCYWSALDEERTPPLPLGARSTDEVYGALGPDDPPFPETTASAPNSPYAASKAASDHFARA